MSGHIIPSSGQEVVRETPGRKFALGCMRSVGLGRASEVYGVVFSHRSSLVIPHRVLLLRSRDEVLYGYIAAFILSIW